MNTNYLKIPAQNPILKTALSNVEGVERIYGNSAVILLPEPFVSEGHYEVLLIEIRIEHGQFRIELSNGLFRLFCEDLGYTFGNNAYKYFETEDIVGLHKEIHSIIQYGVLQQNEYERMYLRDHPHEQLPPRCELQPHPRTSVCQSQSMYILK